MEPPVAEPPLAEPPVAEPPVATPLDVAIIIRSHGKIFIKNDGYQVDIIDFTTFNILNMFTVTLSKLGGCAFGDSDINKFLRQHQIDTKNNKNINLSASELIYKYFFEPTKATSKLYSISYYPVLTKLNGTTDKLYERFDENSQVKLFYCSDSSKTAIINEKLQILTTALHEEQGITRTNILSSLSDLGITNLYFIDLSCDGYEIFPEYKKANPTFILTESGINHVNSYLTSNNIRGGSSIKHKKQKTKHKKQKTKHKKQKTKHPQTRKRKKQKHTFKNSRTE